VKTVRTLCKEGKPCRFGGKKLGGRSKKMRRISIGTESDFGTGQRKKREARSFRKQTRCGSPSKLGKDVPSRTVPESHTNQT